MTATGGFEFLKVESAADRIAEEHENAERGQRHSAN